MMTEAEEQGATNTWPIEKIIEARNQVSLIMLYISEIL